MARNQRAVIHRTNGVCTSRPVNLTPPRLPPPCTSHRTLSLRKYRQDVRLHREMNARGINHRGDPRDSVEKINLWCV